MVAGSSTAPQGEPDGGYPLRVGADHDLRAFVRRSGQPTVTPGHFEGERFVGNRRTAGILQHDYQGILQIGSNGSQLPVSGDDEDPSPGRFVDRYLDRSDPAVSGPIDCLGPEQIWTPLQ